MLQREYFQRVSTGLAATAKPGLVLHFPSKKQQQTTLKIFRCFAPYSPTPAHTRSGLSVSHALSIFRLSEICAGCEDIKV